MAMNSRPALSSPPPISTNIAAGKTQHSNRSSPFPTTSAPDKPSMSAAPSFVPAGHAFRHLPSNQSPYPLNFVTPVFNRERYALFASPTNPMVRVLVRRLPPHTSEESLRLMLVWSKDLDDVELLPVDRSEDERFRCAILRFRSMSGALQARKLLDGRFNVSNDPLVMVDILTDNPPTARPSTAEQTVTKPTVTSSMGSSAFAAPRQPSRFTGFQGLDNSVSPTSGVMFPGNDFIHSDASTHYQKLFSPQSPIGNHLSEPTRVSGKTLISSDFGDDDETSDLLKDPVAYAESGATSRRRATAPHVHTGRMTNYSLSINHSQGPASLPPYMSRMSPSPRLGYSINGRHYPGRHSFPPVNPADQNPPCNTLYVGNLPIDTSEEELKAMFSKQRGYKRLCFRTKQNGPMCFVEFEDISFATKALHELYGSPLHNSIKGGIRLSFSKNPLGVRSGQAPGQAPINSMGGMNGMMNGAAHGYSAYGPPPGLSVPPGLGNVRGNYGVAPFMNTGGNRFYNGVNGYPGIHNHPWNDPYFHHNGVTAMPNGPFNNYQYHYPTPYYRRRGEVRLP